MAFEKGCPSFGNILFTALFPQHSYQPCMLPRETWYLQNSIEIDNPTGFLSPKVNMKEVVAPAKEVMFNSFTWLYIQTPVP